MTTLVLTSLAIFVAFNATIFIAAFQYSQGKSVSNQDGNSNTESRKINNFLYRLASSTNYVCWLTLGFLSVVILSEQAFGTLFIGTLLILWIVFMLLIQHAINQLSNYSSNLGS